MHLASLERESNRDTWQKRCSQVSLYSYGNSFIGDRCVTWMLKSKAPSKSKKTIRELLLLWYSMHYVLHIFKILYIYAADEIFRCILRGLVLIKQLSWAGMKSSSTCKLFIAVVKDRDSLSIFAPLLVADWSSFTVFNDASLMMACSRGVISSSSSSVAAWIEHDSKAFIESWFGDDGWSEASFSSLWSSKSTQALSHAKCSGVFPSSSCTSHAVGQACAMSLTNEAEALEPAATWRGVRPRQSVAAGKCGDSLIISLTMSNGGLKRATAWRRVMPLSSEHADMALEMSRKTVGWERMNRKVAQSWRTMSSRTSPMETNMANGWCVL